MAKSLDQMKREAEKLKERISFLEESQGKIAQYAEAMRSAIREAGFDVDEVIGHLRVKKTRAPRGSLPKKTPESQDSSGAMPEIGTTYKHSSWPEPWTAQGKRAPKYVIAALQSGKSWKQLVAK